MADRQRIRVGRSCTYFPTAAEESAGGGSGPFPATISDVLAAGTVNLMVVEPDGTLIAKTAVSRGQSAGQFDLIGLGPKAP